MPIWLMFIPVAAILQGIVVLFVALGQWITGTYYALAPVGGPDAGRIEIVRESGSSNPHRIEARLADGRVYSATFERGARRAIVRSAPARDHRDVEPAIAIALHAEDGTSMVCHFIAGGKIASSGSCRTPEGRVFEMIAIAADSLPATAAPPRPLG